MIRRRAHPFLPVCAAGSLFNISTMSRGRQQFEARLAGRALFDDEPHCKRGDRDVAIPASPAQRLIFGQAALAVAVLESAVQSC
jgi:hypothetical protein